MLNDSELLPGATNPLIRNSNQLNLVDSVSRRTPTMLTLAQSGGRTPGRDGGIDLTYGLRITKALSVGEARTDGVRVSYDKHSDVSAMLRSDVPDLPPCRVG